MSVKKKNKTTPTNKIVLKPGFGIGYPAAEDDEELLRDCFVDNDSLDTLLDVSSPGSIVLGRTGAGKSAMLMHIRDSSEHCIVLEPSDLALNYISNSTIIAFFESLGVNFDLFFRLLWRHVLCVELLNYHYNVRKRGDFEKAVEKLKAFFVESHSKKLALEYLSSWGSRFWEESQERVKELVDKFEDELKAGVNLTGIGLPIDIGAATKVESSRKVEIAAAATKVISNIQIKKLSTIMEILSDDILFDAQKKYYVVIDRLDENWVDDGIRYKMIRALLETIKDFRKVRNVKIIVSMRTDLIERVYRYTKDSGFQEEKYDALNVQMRWNSGTLFDLVDRRISLVFKRRYTKEGVHFYDIFDSAYRQTGSMFDYIMNRTQHRPRDMIAFINQIFHDAIGKTRIGANDIDRAEVEYSKRRMVALCTEWASEHPNLELCLDAFRRLPTRFDAELIDDAQLQPLLLRLMDVADAPDDIPQLARAYLMNSNATTFDHLKGQLIAVLYKVGALGVRLRHGDPVHFVYDSSFLLRASDITDQTRVSIAPMLWSALGSFRQRVRGEPAEGGAGL